MKYDRTGVRLPSRPLGTKMEHIYKSIDGWFDFNLFYTSVVDRVPDNFVFVELGVWKGKSLAYFVVEAINKNKNGTIYAIDHWLGSEEHQKNSWAYDPLVDAIDGLYNEYNKNISSIRQYITDIRDTSTNASHRFADKSIDAIFIDASHDYDNVLKDISHWYPKVTDTGIISGHDYDWPQVSAAVKDFANSHNLSITRYNNVWELVKQ